MLLIFCFSQGVILVYDITNRWSFDGIDRWIKEIDEVKSGQSYKNYCSYSIQYVKCAVQYDYEYKQTWVHNSGFEITLHTT